MSVLLFGGFLLLLFSPVIYGISKRLTQHFGVVSMILVWLGLIEFLPIFNFLTSDLMRDVTNLSHGIVSDSNGSSIFTQIMIGLYILTVILFFVSSRLHNRRLRSAECVEQASAEKEA